MNYPKDWERCPACDAPALDGHVTCGNVVCNESEQRNKRQGAIGLAWQKAQDAWQAAGAPVPCYDPAYMAARAELAEAWRKYEAAASARRAVWGTKR